MGRSGRTLARRISQGRGDTVQTVNRDKVTAPAEVSIRFERVVKDDYDMGVPDHLTQDYADVTDEAERAKYLAQDAARVAAFERDEWHNVGVICRAHIEVPIGGNSVAVTRSTRPDFGALSRTAGRIISRKPTRKRSR